MRKLNENESTLAKTFRIQKGELKAIEELCETLGLSFGEFMRDAMRIHYHKHHTKVKELQIAKLNYYKQIREFIGYDIGEI